MTTDTVTIGCRLPHGLILEVGYQTTRKGADGKVFAHYQPGSNYRRFVLKGTSEHTLPARAQGIQVVSNGNPEPYLNKDVPKDLWEEWLKRHPNSWYVKSMNLYEVKGGDDSNALAMKLDSMSQRAILAPIDPKGDPRAPKRTDKHSGVQKLTKDE